MNLRRYSRMKESEIPGIDQVPEHWHLNRMDRVMAHQRNQVSEESMNGKLVFHYSIPSIQETGDGRYELGDEVQSGKLLVSDEVLLVSRLNPHKGCVALASPKEVLTVCSTEFVPLKATACDLRFAYYLFLSRHTVEHIVSTVQSATRSHMRAEPEVITKMWQYFPSQEEQVSIVSFLDTTLRVIDGAVRKSQLLIDRLHEYRQALITQAVTKGLDPNVPMKESGISWAGTIPEYWQTIR